TGGLLGVTGFLGLRRFGFVAGPKVAGLSFGRVVRNAPRTSSSCTGAAIPITTAHRQTNPKAMTLNRISESPSVFSVSICVEYGCRRQSDCYTAQALILPSRTALVHSTHPTRSPVAFPDILQETFSSQPAAPEIKVHP